MKGKFITFEGSEGCGKSTQSRLLYLHLKKQGFPVVYLREPGGTKVSEKIRNMLLDPGNKSLTAECELLLYMASRSQVVSEVIEPALKKGKVVISDRFLDSTLAYQGYGLGIDLGFIKQVGRFSTHGLKPDLTIFLDTPLRQCFKAIGRARDRIERRKFSYHQKVRRGYLTLAQKEPGRFKIIRLERDKHNTQEKIRAIVSQLLK
ncbi:MAG: dTMP kinase [Candidatus Omnitrophica bacterium]|nr:dTMP kinase [Candidatus Omnitrophota bacterium]